MFPRGISHLAFYVDVNEPVLEWHLDGTKVQAMIGKSQTCPQDMDAEIAKLPRDQ